MFSTETTTEGDTVEPHSFLFDSSHDLLGDQLNNGAAELDFSLKGDHIDSAGFGGFDHNGLYDRYDESGQSSIQPGDINDFSEPGGSHMSTKDDAEPEGTATPAASGTFDIAEKEVTKITHLGSPAEEHVEMKKSQSEESNAGGRLPGQSALLASKEPSPTAVNGHSVKDTMAKSSSKVPSHRLHNSLLIDVDAPDSSEYSPMRDSPSTMAPPTHGLATRNPPVFKAKSSIPAHIPVQEFARQCILAAQSSRLNPFTLHPGEYELLRDHITHTQVTVYLNIRNAILRLWTRNPLVAVTKSEAAGCAKDTRYFNMTQVAYRWLVQHGYINFGCVELQSTAGPIPRAKSKGGKRRTIVVVGAGVSGLGCARQLEGLVAQLGDKWTNNGERPPTVIVLEGRRRIGGRVYSHPLKGQTGSTLPSNLRPTAEMGAQIITGFEHGNPMNIIVRGQLGLHYHALKDDTVLYDHDGSTVDREGPDMLVEKLYNDILERASLYRNKPPKTQTLDGDKRLIQLGRDPPVDQGQLVASLEASGESKPVAGVNKHNLRTTFNANALMGLEKLAGRAYTLAPGSGSNVTAAEAAKNMGWQLKPSVEMIQNLELQDATQAPEHPTLGATMDEAVKQYQSMLHMTPLDMRLFNWHHANMEYSNAANVSQLSLGGWDQDIGNEFEGQHCQVIGGYQQVPRGLWQCPTQLDVRFNTAVKAVRHVDGQHLVECTNGEVVEADEVVMTLPLGVLKQGDISFDPPLPDWKTGPVERLGFGLLNKVVLVYDEPFWEPDRDMFGALNEAELQDSLEQKDHANRRGRFWLFWNCLKTSGKPTLVALMAGNAAHDTEVTDNQALMHEATERLSKMFGPKATVPLPREVIVTRWKKDPYARGSYSYMGPQAQPGDYEAMARPVGTLHFAGEATCGTHPATVHGAYLSGLRAAAEVVESMLGSIEVPHPLVAAKVKHEAVSAVAGVKRAAEDSPDSAAKRQARNEDFESLIEHAIFSALGERPRKPERTGNNPYLIYTRDHWHSTKAECDEQRKSATGDASAKASKDSIRTVLGAKWRNASAEVQRPYHEEASRAKARSAALAAEYKETSAVWDREAARIRKEFITNNPLPGVKDDVFGGGRAVAGRERRVIS